MGYYGLISFLITPSMATVGDEKTGGRKKRNLMVGSDTVPVLMVPSLNCLKIRMSPRLSGTVSRAGYTAQGLARLSLSFMWVTTCGS